MRDDQFLAIHQALHRWDGISQRQLRLGDEYFPLFITPRAQVKSVIIHGIKFVEQNTQSGTTYAAQALAGARITWAIPLAKTGRKWGMIVDDEVVTPVPEA